ncbi:C-C motif chemokine 18-like [Kryptolebias marmoratus]|uniref:C-C motif chemokine n=1 Tax=Kryptolebias marmoratus TaxID=37003 RepID=A0A3Q2ZMY6_KRYMA|nr:C-C motif chemokine 18-like [Kryptolebias marmoratus]
MAPWGDAKFLFCILFITFCCTMTVAEIPMDCCLSVGNKSIRARWIVDYREQDKGCSVAAIILVTKLGRKLCVPPNKDCVQKAKDHVDKLRENCKNNNYKGKRCAGVKRE